MEGIQAGAVDSPEEEVDLEAALGGVIHRVTGHGKARWMTPRQPESSFKDLEKAVLREAWLQF